MNENKRRDSDHSADNHEVDSSPTGQHPEWHPFAVWQTQIRQHQTSQTGQHRILQSRETSKA